MKRVFAIFAIWFVCINLFALVAANRFNLNGDSAYAWIDPHKAAPQQSWNLPSLHAKWDSFWYLDIIEHGYQYQPGQLSNLVFFPLYPLIVKIVGLLFLSHFIFAGWLVSSVCLFFAAWFLYKLAKEFHPEGNPSLAVILLLIFPTAFFFNAVYTESLFLLLSICCFYYLFKGKFIVAALLGFLAALTRITGILLFIPIAIEYYGVYKESNLFDRRWLWAMLVPFGTFCFFLFHYVKFGSFALFFEVEKLWGRNFTFNKGHVDFFSHPSTVNALLDFGFVVMGLVVIYFVYRRLRVSYAAYMLATLLVALSSGTFMSIGRYVSVLFPLYILGSMVKNEYTRYAWIFISVLLFGLYTILFVNYYWAG
jgi:hypothetical protein